MPQKTDLNVAPYFDDFDEAKNYHRILARPKMAVQAREFTQAQSILQNQIERFGNWAFRNGDIVSGCTIQDIPVFPFLRLSDYQANGATFDTSALIGKEAVCLTTNLRARVLYSNTGFEVNYPDTNIIYLAYLNTGTGGETIFANGNQITFYNVPQTGNVTADTVAVVNAYVSNSTTATSGNGHGISVSDGVVFLSGCFVAVHNPSIGIVNNYGTYAGNNVVGFEAEEEIVTENQDETLFDNALGYKNENAPGAHRLKITPTLVTVSNAAAVNVNFNPIAVFNYGALVSKVTSSANIYSVFGQIISNRTYEESGNYVVNPFAADSISTVPGNSVGGTISANNFLGRVSPGKGYALGYPVELLATAYTSMRRGVDTLSQSSQLITFNYGGYFQLKEYAGSFSFTNAATVYLYNKAQGAVTNRTFSGLSPTGNNIGTAQVRGVYFNSGTPGTSNAIYNLHVFNISLANGYSTRDIASVYANVGGIYGVGDLVSSYTFESANKDQLYSFGVNGLKNLRDANNNNRSQYVFRTRKASTMATNGAIVVTLAASATGGTDVLPYGNGIVPELDAANFVVVATANVDTAALAGTVNCFSSNTYVVGSGTAFTTDFAPGYLIKVGSEVRSVATVSNNTVLNVDAPFTAGNTGATYYRSFLQGKPIPISQSLNTNKPAYVTVTNTTSFTITTNQNPSGSLGVDVIFDTLRTNVSPATKTINKSRWVKISANAASNPRGPWCLGFPDVHKINKIYGSNDGSYTTAGVDLTNAYVLETGQKDTHYDLAYLYAKPSTDPTTYPYLLVNLDYFTANTAAGVGFFTVESYPIDDANTSNTTAIQTKDIPLYIDEQGQKTWLRDYIDFRIPSTPTANDTGYCNTSNATNVTTTIGYATVNPSSTLALQIPAGGLNTPSYGQNWQSDYTIYLSRKDLLMITTTGDLKIKEGVSSVSPQTPLYPENAMPIAVYNIPPFPSLTSDQVDSLYAVNKTARNLIRDTSTSITTSIVTNRRYTMRDVGKLDQRITNLEYYQQLSILEKRASDLLVTDANGLDRFKNGIFVDSFNDFSLMEVSNPEFGIAIDSARGVARPRFVREVVAIDLFNTLSTVNNANTGNRNFYIDSTNHIQKTGRCITLPYNEVPFMVQPFATQYRSAALVAFAWTGRCILIPAYDNNQDVINTGSINIVVDNATPWAEFANSVMGTQWGAWRTTTSTVSNSVTSGTQETFNVNLGNFFGRSQQEADAAALAQIHQVYGTNIVIGNISVRLT